MAIVKQLKIGLSNEDKNIMENKIKSDVLFQTAGGSPKGVYDNLSSLQAALPNGAEGVYITKDNGHWNYWNGSAWVDGGLYLSTGKVITHNGNQLKDENNNNLYPNIIGENIPDNAVTTSKLATNSVTEGKISDGAVTENKIADYSVTTSKIADGAVTRANLSEDANNAIDAPVTTSKLADGAVTESKIGNGAVTTSKITNYSVTENKIQDGAVTESKIGNGAVTTSKITNYSVTENKIRDGAVTENKIQDGAVTENKIRDGAVTTSKIADGAVTRDKLSPIVNGIIDNLVSANNDIKALIPNQASSDNQLADKDFVNSSIDTSTATFQGTYDDVSQLPTEDDGVNKNDYAYIDITDELGNRRFDKYKYTIISYDEPVQYGWVYEYTLNNSSFTEEQWKAINSGITDSLLNEIIIKKIDYRDIIDNLETELKNKVLSANQGVVLKQLIESKVNEVKNILEGKQNALATDNTINLVNDEISVNTDVIANKDYVHTSFATTDEMTTMLEEVFS